jgi:hypothetical protein
MFAPFAIEPDGPGPPPQPPTTDEGLALAIPEGHPLLSDKYPDIQTLKDALNAWGKLNSIGFATSSGSNKHPKDPSVYLYYKVYCNRGGAARGPQGKGVRTTSTTKTNCPWKAVASAHKADGYRFKIRVACNDHNHDPTESGLTHRQHQGLDDEMKAAITSMSAGSTSVPPREILTTLQRQFPTKKFDFTTKDIKNYRHLLQREKLDGYSPTQALIKELEGGQIFHRTLYDAVPGKEKRLRAIFWSFPSSQQQLRRSPLVLQMDNTYRTNRFKMPFFHITAMTNVGSVASIAFGLVDNEREEGYTWLLEQLKSLYDMTGQPMPSVVITDQDNALKNALLAVFSTTTQQLCIFHINKNVALRIKQKWPLDKSARDEDNGNPFHEGEDEYEAQTNDDDNDDDSGALYTSARNHATNWAVPDTVPHTKAGLYSLWKAMMYTAKESDFNRA